MAKRRRGFVHLHNHMDQSLLDGFQGERGAMETAQEQGMIALGFTDHGNCHCHYQAWKNARDLDMKPILGCEVFLAPSGDEGQPSDRFHKKPIRWTRARAQGRENEQAEGKGVAGAGKYTHQTILARNAEGLRNLWRITSKASRDGFYGGRARADHALLREHSAGLIATSGCPSGELQTRLRLGQTELAHQVVERDLEIFGRDHYFLELMDHGLKIERDVRPALMEIQKRYNLRPLATNDSHYARKSDAVGHDELLAIQTGVWVESPDRWRFDTDGDCKINPSYYLKSPDEMWKLFKDIPEACENTLLVAEMVEDGAYDEVFTYANGIRMPHFPVPDGYTPESYLRELTYEGAHQRWGASLPVEVVQRLEYELNELIVPNGFVDYFLVLWDMCRFMRERDIKFGPRGSAAGSAVIYALFVSGMDPLKFGLMVERFLNPDRISPPDVDVDIEDKRRGEVIEYLRQKYGEELVGGIITFGRLGGKEAIRDAARILGMERGVGDALSKEYPAALFGKPMYLEDIYNSEHERFAAGAKLREMVAQNPEKLRDVIDTARRIEKRLRKNGKHACGVVVGDGPLIDLIPLTYQTNTGMPHIGFEYADAEEMKLQKLDALGLRNLTILSQALADVERLYGVKIDIDDQSFDDPKVYELLAAGHTLSVFQLESGGMRQLLRMMKPTTFDDIMAVGALYRPGPMGMESHTKYALRKNGLEPVTPIHPELEAALEEVLAPTFGLITFQEQVMQAVQKVAGFTPGKADILRKAMGKKKKADLDKMRVEFDAGALAKGHSQEAADALWRTLEPFADYAFNKCTSGETDIVRLGRGSHPGSQKVRDIANRLHGREDYDGTGCRYCYNEAGRAVSPRSAECKACKSWRAKWRMHNGMNAAGRIGDRVLPVKIVDVFRQGVKPLWKMTLANGMSLTSTMNHQHLTPEGWRRLDELRVGDAVSTMAEGEWNVQSPRSDFTGIGNDWYAAPQTYMAVARDGELRPHLHGRYGQFMDNIATLERVCAHCGREEADTKRLERAHLDGDPLNNEAANLALLCTSCHKKHDYANGGRVKMWRKGRSIESSAIVSIEYVGEEMTYDVTVDSEDHSWVANGGIITHNSHTACYGRIAYWTAYLKAYFPVAYMAAVLEAEAGDKEKLAIYLAECRRMGIKVLVPDVNASEAAFAPQPDGTIRYGLASIAGMGEKVAQAVVRGRRAGPYTGFVDFLERAGVEACTKKAVQAMVDAGAFDSIEPNRRALFVAAELAANAAKKAKDLAAKGQVDLFAGTVAGADEDPDDPRISMVGISFDLGARPFERLEQLERERAVLGLYLSGHPLNGREAALLSNRSESTVELLSRDYTGYENLDRKDKKLMTQLSGLITGVEIKHRKVDGLPFAAVTLEDLDGVVEIMFWANKYPDVAEALVVGNMVAVRSGIWVKPVGGGSGLVEDDGSDPDAAVTVPEVEITYTGQDVKILENIGPDDPVIVWLRQDRLSLYSREDLDRICREHPGGQLFQFGLMTPQREELPWRSEPVRVEMSSAFFSEIKELVGRGAFTITPAVRLAKDKIAA